MATDKVIIEANEIEANKSMRKFLLASIVLGLLLWILCILNVINADKEKTTVIILCSIIITAAVTMLTKALKHASSVTKYILVVTLIYDTFICSRFIVTEAWPFMLLPIILSLRYFNMKFTIIIGVIDLIAFIFGFYNLPLSVIYITTFAVITVACAIMANIGRKLLANQQRAALGAIHIKDKLHNDKLHLLSSQLQSHFINNSLNTICYLCEDNPEEASKAVADFASYLRTNLSILNGDENVSFRDVLDHVKTYVDLEKRRFGDKLQVVYDTPVTGFMLPPLSVQPIVENAIKHGVCDRIRGGKVIIMSREDDKSYKVIIKDDGVGFDVYILDRDEYKGIGINSIKTRLKNRLGGNIEVVSEPGIGTEVTITIPKEIN